MGHHHKKKHSGEPVAEGEAPETPEATPKSNEKIEVPVQEYEDLKKKVEELEGLRQKFLVSAADYENAKKRNAREKEDFIKFSQERILRELLPVTDNFDRALSHVTALPASAVGDENSQKHFQALVSGVQMVQKQFLDILKRNGLKRLETAGQQFDPHFHEAIAHVPEEGKEDQIVDEMEPGYMLHDRLLRAAKVRVRVNPQPPASDPEVKQEENT